jgi:hypothetical protein
LGDRPEDEKKATSATYEAEESKKENIWKSSLPYLPPAMKEKLGEKKEAKFLLLNLVRKERYPLLMRAEEEYLAV